LHRLLYRLTQKVTPRKAVTQAQTVAVVVERGKVVERRNQRKTGIRTRRTADLVTKNKRKTVEVVKRKKEAKARRKGEDKERRKEANNSKVARKMLRKTSRMRPQSRLPQPLQL